MNDPVAVMRLVSDTAMVTLIWLVQLIIYPAFRTVEKDSFIRWHGRYMRIISYFVIPLMLIQAGCIATRVLHRMTALSLISVIAVAAAWLVTFTVSAPCHRRLQHLGSEASTIERLIRTNWIRTAGWSLAWTAGLLEFSA